MGTQQLAPNLSRAVTLVTQFARASAEEFNDLGAFWAPSECRGLVARGQAEDFRHLRRLVKSLTGLSWQRFELAVEERTTPKWAYQLFSGVPSRLPVMLRRQSF